MEASTAYFQRRLIGANDDLLHDDVAIDLSMLGLRLRELQQMPIVDAFAKAHGMVRQIADTAIRRRMMLDLFGEVEE